MSFLDTPLGERLQTSLKGANPDQIAAVAHDLGAKVWAGSLTPEEVAEVMARLERHREFRYVIDVGEAAMAVGAVGAGARRRYCQALIETGALHAAELALQETLETVDDPKERGEILGLMGRARKQRFVTGGKPDDLVSAIDAYRRAYQGKTDPAWHGVNLLALACRADHDGIAVPDAVDTKKLADEILAVARDKEPELRSVWERSTEIEALLAMGDEEHAAEAVSAAEKLATSKEVSPFQLRSLLRQLMEIWQLEPHHPLLLAIADRQLQLGADSRVDFPSSPLQLEKIFGTELPVGYNHLRRGLQCAESVAKITDASGEPWGTGFLLKGSLIHPELGEAPILITNAHVCSPDVGVGKLVPGEAQAVFDVTKSVGGENLVITGLECVWTSPPETCDVTFLRFTGPQAAISEPIEMAPVPEPVIKGAYVYVIGHPAGGGLKFSIRGNGLIGYDAAEMRVHYRAPTEGGSSGSPVFNQAWQLMAVHHAGDSKMRRLDDSSVTYEANEGITLKAIREEFERKKPVAQ